VHNIHVQYCIKTPLCQLESLVRVNKTCMSDKPVDHTSISSNYGLPKKLHLESKTARTYWLYYTV